MIKFRALIVLAASAVALSACAHGGFRGHSGPDEFAVTRQAPLAVPPDFALTPPAPGAPRATEGDSSREAMEALFGPPAPRSAVESNTISRAGSSEPGIRSVVGDPKTQTVAKGAVTRDILAAPQGDGAEAQASTQG